MRSVHAMPNATLSGLYFGTTYALNASQFDALLPNRPFNISADRSERADKLPAHWAQLLANNTPEHTVKALHDLFTELFEYGWVESVELFVSSNMRNPRLVVHYADKNHTRRRIALKRRHSAVYRILKSFLTHAAPQS